MNTLKKTMQQIENTLTAISFAEEGEFDTAIRILKEDKSILLAVKEGYIDRRTLNYAKNISKRIGAKLDILFISSDSDNLMDSMLQQFLFELQSEGVDYRLIPIKWEGILTERYRSNSKIIRSIMKDVTPLQLIDIADIEINPEDFKTIHDIIWFIHEVYIKEIIRAVEVSEVESSSYQLVSDRIPLCFYIIDLDGGVEDKAKFLRKISPDHIRSIPFKALWRGMNYEGVRWSHPVGNNSSKFSSTKARLFCRPRYIEKHGNVYVITTEQYLNLNVKLAHHLSAIDAFCGESHFNNYINFRFQEGSAIPRRRCQPTLFIKKILESMDFIVKIKGDTILADIKGVSQHETENKLDMLGRLIGCSKQLYKSIKNIEFKDWYVKAFLEGNCSFVYD